MEQKEIVREEEAKKILKDLDEQYELNKLQELVSNNMVEFEHNEKKYRVRMLNLREKDELDQLRRKKFGQLIQDKDILLEKDLIKVYKERGLDIDEIAEKYQQIEKEEFAMQLKLGKALAEKVQEAVLKAYKDELIKMEERKRILLIQRISALEYSLENQLLNYVAQIITYLSLEKFENDKWERAYNTFESFQNSEDEKLINTAAKFSTLLQHV
jgi:hypothetical protein